MYTGAGGSIGSELCRQILMLRPKSLILLEQNEPCLYSIYHELSELNSLSIKIVPILADVKNEDLLSSYFNKHTVEVVFHAAAYKHVPLVEANPLEGIANNVFSTLAIYNASRACSVEKVVLISTDKAVRPTNVMGLQVLAELIFSLRKRIYYFLYG